MKKLICLATSLVLTLCSTGLTHASESEAGDCENNPILISSAKQLQDLAWAVSFKEGNEAAAQKYYMLTADIDFSGYSYAWGGGTDSFPFGHDARPFQGHFDGNGHVIKNFTVTANSGGYGSSGFFGAAGDGAVIKNLGFENTNVRLGMQYKHTGALIGKATGNVTVENTYFRNTTYTENASDWGAGFVAVLDNANLTIQNCYMTGTNSAITSFQLRGEFFAFGDNSTVNLTNCYTDTNQFAPKPNDTSNITVNMSQCYANADGYSKDWNNYDTYEWLGTKLSSADLKNAALGVGFAADKNLVNNGYPVLRWELGEETQTIEINSEQELQNLAIAMLANTNNESKLNYKLMRDLDFSGFSYVWGNGTDSVPFGTDDIPFCGTFDGNGHVIKNFAVTAQSGGKGSSGLFGAVGDGAVIKNLGLENTSVRLHATYTHTGALVGKATGAVTIENTFLRNTTYPENASDWGAGFVAVVSNANLTIKNCYATGTNSAITAFQLRGEFFAWGDSSTVTLTNCYTDTNQFAPKPGADITVITENCYANAEGHYKSWNNFNTFEWLGNTLTPEVLKTNLYGTAFAADTQNKNNGYPVLAWEAGLDTVKSFNLRDGQLKNVIVEKRTQGAGKLYACVYDENGRLETVKTADVTESGMIDLGVNIPSETSGVRVFILSGFMQPQMSMGETIQ